MRYHKIIGLFFLLSFVSAEPISGLWSFDDTYTGTAVLPFLKLQPNGRALAMGGALGSIDRGAQSYFSNPALLASEYDFSLSVNHSEILGEWQHESAVLNLPIPNWGALGFALNTLRTGTFGDSRDESEDLYSFSATDFLVGVSWAQAIFPERLDGGVTLEYLQSRIDDITGRGYAMSFGLKGYLVYGLQASMTLKNLSHGFRYRDNGPLEPLPLIFQFSAGLPLGPDLPFAAQLGYEKSNEGTQILSLGYEHAVLPWLFLRSGYRYSLVANDQGWLNGASAGLGVVIGPFALDYGAQYRDNLGWHQIFSLQFGSFPTHQNIEKDPLTEAQEEWEKGKCASAKRYAQQALEQDPQAVKAMWIIDHCQKEELIANGKIINLLVSANTNGQISPTRINGKLLGGIARRASLIEDMRYQHPQIVLLDAGNPWQEPSKSHSQVNYEEELRDLNVQSTQGDLVKRKELLLEAYDKMDYHWINQTQCDSLCILSEKIIDEGNVRFRLLSTKTSKLDQQQLNDFWVSQYIPPQDTLSNVLLLNGSIEQARQIAQLSPSIKLIVLSGQVASQNTFTEGSTHIVMPGLNGTHLSWLQIGTGSKDPYFYEKHLEVHSGLAPQADMKELLASEILYPEDTLRYLPIAKETRKGFLYKVESPEATDLYFHDLSKNFGHLIYSEFAQIKEAQMAFTRNKVAFSAIDSAQRKQLFLLDLQSKESVPLLYAGESLVMFKWDALENRLWFWVETQPGLFDLRTVRPSGTDLQVLISQTSIFPKQIDFALNGKAMSLLMQTHQSTQILTSTVEPFNPIPFKEINGKIKSVAYGLESSLYVVIENPTGFGPDEILRCTQKCEALFHDLNDSKVLASPMGPIFSDSSFVREFFLYDETKQSQLFLSPRQDIKTYSDSPPVFGFNRRPLWIYTREHFEEQASETLITTWPDLKTIPLKLKPGAQLFLDN